MMATALVLTWTLHVTMGAAGAPAERVAFQYPTKEICEAQRDWTLRLIQLGREADKRITGTAVCKPNRS